MANDPSPNRPLPAGASTTLNLRSGGESVVVYQHSTLFYWWPVWAVGFLFAALSYFGDYHMAIVPAGTMARSDVAVTDEAGRPATRDVLVLGQNKKHLTRKNSDDQEVTSQPTIFVSRYRSLGTIFLFVLLLVIFITNVTLRGQWSLVVIIVMIAVVVIFQILGWWERIFERLGNLSIYINLGGYMMISLVVFGLWVLNFFIFDRQLYVIFSPGQVRLCLEIGSGETIYDSAGMTVQKQRSDLFRHSILGFGSGDIVLRFPRIDHPIELHNVLNVGRTLKRIERLTKEKIVVTEGERAPANPTPTA